MRMRVRFLEEDAEAEGVVAALADRARAVRLVTTRCPRIVPDPPFVEDQIPVETMVADLVVPDVGAIGGDRTSPVILPACCSRGHEALTRRA